MRPITEEPRSWRAETAFDASIEELRLELEAVRAVIEAHDKRIYAADLVRLAEGVRSDSSL